MDDSDLRETQDEPEERARFARAMWLSGRDCQDAIRGAALSALPENPVTVNVVSANDDRYLSLTHAIREIGYRPRDNAAERLGEGTR